MSFSVQSAPKPTNIPFTNIWNREKQQILEQENNLTQTMKWLFKTKNLLINFLSIRLFSSINWQLFSNVIFIIVGYFLDESPRAHSDIFRCLLLFKRQCKIKNTMKLTVIENSGRWEIFRFENLEQTRFILFKWEILNPLTCSCFHSQFSFDSKPQSPLLYVGN